MTTLAERVEAADGPDRELDAEIFIAVCWPDWCIQTNCDDFPHEVQPGRIQEPNGCGWRRAPAYTASIDAAMTLVPEGWQVIYHSPNPNNPPSAHRVELWLKTVKHKGRHRTDPALALTAAALRARESKPSSLSGGCE